MIPALRIPFNAAWTPQAYARLLDRLQEQTGVAFAFKVCETPCFFPRALMEGIARAGTELVHGYLADHAARAAADAAVPEAYRGPGQEAFPTFVQVDFGLIRNAAGEIEPRLVELQAFPSLYALQHTLALAYRDIYGLPESLGVHLDGLDGDSYLALLREAIVGAHDPAEVVLMEIDPRGQKTLPDFVRTEQLWGVRAIDTSDVEVDGRRFTTGATVGACRSSASTTASSPMNSSAPAADCPSTTVMTTRSSGPGTRRGTSG